MATVSSRGVTVKGVTVKGVTVKGVTVKGVTVKGVTVKGVTVKGVTVKGVTVKGCDRDGCDREGCDRDGVVRGGRAYSNEGSFEYARPNERLWQPPAEGRGRSGGPRFFRDIERSYANVWHSGVRTRKHPFDGPGRSARCRGSTETSGALPPHRDQTR